MLFVLNYSNTDNKVKFSKYLIVSVNIKYSQNNRK